MDEKTTLNEKSTWMIMFHGLTGLLPMPTYMMKWA
jgi:hypothetical protein